MILMYPEPPSSDPIDAAVVELDVDPTAERYILMDRGNLMLLWHGIKPDLGNAKIRVPLDYVIDYRLMALIIDDAGDPLHYVTGNDKIQATLVDARTVQLNP